MKRPLLSHKSSRDTLAAYLFMLPITAILLYFMGRPIILCFIRSLYNGKGEYIGLNNVKLFLGETRFINNVKITVIYAAFSVILIIPSSMLAAHLIVEDTRFVRILRPLYLIPWVIPYVCSSILFRSMFNGQGPVTSILHSITGKQFMFLSKPNLALMVILLHQFWRAMPYAMLFIAAGLTTISKELYEAATIDGANRWRRFTDITLPILKGHFFVVTLMVTNGALQDSESIWSITGGGPGTSTETIAVRLFKDSFKNFDMNSASVLGVVLLLIASVFIILYNRAMRTMEEDVSL